MANRIAQRGNAQLAIRRRLLEILHDLREARIRLGLSQADVARALRCSAARIGRLERGEVARIAVVDVAAYAAVVGYRLSLMLHLSGSGLRDRRQLEMMNQYRGMVAPGGWRIEVEVPVGPGGDLRAVDLVLARNETRVGHEFISRFRDAQAQVRPLRLKQANARLTRLILVIAGTDANRRAVAEAGSILRDAFPLGTRQVLSALRRGIDPGADGIVFL